MRSNREKIEEYQPTWGEYHERYIRSLVEIKGRQVCGDPKLELSWRAAENHMNKLLEDLFAENVTLEALDGIPHGEVIDQYATSLANQGKGQE